MKFTKSQIEIGKWSLLLIGLLIFCHYIKKKKLIEGHSPISDNDPWFTISDMEKYCGIASSERHTLMQQMTQGEGRAQGVSAAQAQAREFNVGQAESSEQLRLSAEAAEALADTAHGQMEQARTRMQDKEIEIANSLTELRNTRTSCQRGTR